MVGHNSTTKKSFLTLFIALICFIATVTAVVAAPSFSTLDADNSAFTGEDFIVSGTVSSDVPLDEITFTTLPALATDESFVVDGTSVDFVFTVSVPEDLTTNFVWLVEANDTAGFVDFEGPFEVLVIDTIHPTVENVLPFAGWYSEDFTISADVDDNINIQNVTAELFNGANSYTYVLSPQGGISYSADVALVDIEDGNYTLVVTGTDVNGNDFSASNEGDIAVDTTLPSIFGFTSSPLGNPRSDTTMTYTVSVVEANVQSVNLNGTEMEALGAGIYRTTATPGDFGCTTTGNCTLTASVTDFSNNTNSTSITLEVLNIPYINGTIENIETDEDTSIAVSLEQYEADVDNTKEELSWTVEGFNASVYTASVTSEDVLIITPVEHAFTVTADTLTLTLYDTDGLFTSQDVEVFVSEVNDFPVITSVPETLAMQGVEYVYTMTSTDVEGDNVAYTVNDSRFDQSLEGGNFSWIPDQSDVDEGSIAVTFIATDSRGGSTTQNVVIDISNDNDRPEIVAIPDMDATEDILFSYTVLANDPDNDSLEYSLVTFPDGMIIDNVTGEIIWIPGNAQVGTNDVTVAVTDSELEDTESFTISVANTNDAPSVPTLLSPVNGSILATITGSVLLSWENSTDVDGDLVSYIVTLQNETDVVLETTVVNTSYLFEGVENATVYTWSVRATDGVANSTLSEEWQFYSPQESTITFSLSSVELFEDTPLRIDLHNYTVEDDAVLTLDDIVYSIDGHTLNASCAIQDDHFLFVSPVSDYYGSGDTCSIRLNNGFENVTADIAIDVVSVNDAPTFVTDHTAFTFDEGSAFSIELVADDVDLPFDDLAFVSEAALPEGFFLTQLNTTHAILNGTIPTTVDTYNANISITDLAGNVSYETFDIIKQPVLQLTDLDITAGQTTFNNLQAGGSVIAQPQDVIVIDADLTNTLDIAIEDIVLVATLSEVGLTNETTAFNIQAAGTKEKELSFTLPLAIDEGDYELSLYASGIDEEDSPHIMNFDVTLTLDKDRHDIVVDSASLSRETVQCMPYTDLSVVLSNHGSETEDDITLTISNAQLGISETVDIPALGSSEQVTTVTSLRVDDAFEGVYTIPVEGVYNNGDNTFTTVVTPLEVVNCGIPILHFVEDRNNTLNLTLSDIVNDSNLSHSVTNTLNNSLISCSFDSETTVLSCFDPDHNDNLVGNTSLNWTIVDDEYEITYTIDIEVTGENDYPEMTDLGSYTIEEDSDNHTYNLSAFSFDPDGDSLTYAVVVEQDNAVSCTVDGTTLDVVAHSNYIGDAYCSIQATDGTLFSNVVNITFDITPLNDAPALEIVGNLTVEEDTEMVLTLNGTDVDEDTLVYSTNTTFGNLVDDTFTWTPQFTDIGSYTVNFSVTDGTNVTTETVILNVVNKNNAPNIEFVDGVPNATQGQLVSFTVIASDADFTFGDELTFSINDSAFNVEKLNTTTAEFSFTPTNDDVGIKSVLVIVTDSFGANDTAGFEIEIQDVNDAPTLAPTPETDPAIGTSGSVIFEANAEDIDGDTLTYLWELEGDIVGTDETYTFTANSTLGTYALALTVSDGEFNETADWTINVVSGPTSSSGNYTISYTEVTEGDLTNVTSLIISRAGFGSINFGTQSFDVSSIVDIDANVLIGEGIVGIDSDSFTVFKGANAAITLEGIVANETPLMMYTESFPGTTFGICPNTVCGNLVYNTLTDTLTFDVATFSTYLVNTSASSDTTADLSGTITFGSKDQEASNPNQNEDIFDQATVTITNDGISTIVINGFDSVPVSPFDADDLQIALDENVTIVPGASAEVKMTARISEKVDAVDRSLKETSQKVSDLTFTGTKGGVPSSDLGTLEAFMQRENNLIIDEVEANFADESDNLDEGEELDELKPGDDITLEITVENQFTRSSNVEIENVEIRSEADDGDLDFDEEEDAGDIQEDDDKTESLTIDIDDDIDDGTYDYTISTEGIDLFGARHGELWEMSIEVEEDDDDIRIERLSLSPDTVSLCERRTALLSLSVFNAGSDDQNDVTIEVTSDELGFFERVDDIELDDDDSTSKTFGIIPPRNIAPGTYPITVEAFYDTDVSSDQRVTQVTFLACLDGETVVDVVSGTDDGSLGGQDNSDIFLRSAPFVPAQPVFSDITPQTTTKKQSDDVRFTDSSLYLTLLIILFILLVGLMIFIVGAFAILLDRKKKKQKKMRMRRKQMMATHQQTLVSEFDDNAVKKE